MIASFCISLKLNSSCSEYLSELTSNLELIQPQNYNCFYHTTILQFASFDSFEEICNQISNKCTTKFYRNLINDLDNYTSLIEPTNNFAESIYSPNLLAIMLRYEDSPWLNYYSKSLAFAFQPYTINPLTDLDLLSPLIYDTSNYSMPLVHTAVFPLRSMHLGINPHTTLGFTTHENNGDYLRRLSSIYESNTPKRHEIGYSGVYFSRLNEYCMTDSLYSISIRDLQ